MTRLISVHVEDSDEAERVRTIFTEERGEDISTGREAVVPTQSRGFVGSPLPRCM